MREHEPHVAIFAKGGPLGAYLELAAGLQEILAENPHFLAPARGYLVIEVGHGQRHKVIKIFATKLSEYFVLVDCRTDYNGLQRCLVFARR